jgi:hypothetical protein
MGVILLRMCLSTDCDEGESLNKNIMFKRINLLLLIVLSVMTVAPARALECSPNSSIILSNGGQDSSTYKFKTSGEQNIFTAIKFLGTIVWQGWEFHTDCFLFPTDLQKGDTTLGKIQLPTNAKVTGMKLDGYNNGGKTTTIYISTYISNTKLTEIPSRNSGYNDYNDIANLGGGTKYTDNKECKFPDGTSSTNRLTLLDLPFSKPFIYTGGNVALVLDMSYSGDPMDFYYNTATASANSTVIRTGNYGSGYIGGDLSTLPAVAIKYYTNDLRGTFTDLTGAPIVESVSGKTVDETGPYVRLVDLTDNNKVIGKVHPAADGSFSFINLDPTHKYHLSAASYSYGYIEKDVTFTAKNGSLDYADDILATIKMEKSDVVTGLNAVGANGGMTILGSKSSITVIANGNSKVAVYDVTGRLVRQADVVAGSNSIDDLVPGIYIVNHVKVAVK